MPGCSASRFRAARRTVMTMPRTIRRSPADDGEQPLSIQEQEVADVLNAQLTDLGLPLLAESTLPVIPPLPVASARLLELELLLEESRLSPAQGGELVSLRVRLEAGRRAYEWARAYRRLSPAERAERSGEALRFALVSLGLPVDGKPLALEWAPPATTAPPHTSVESTAPPRRRRRPPRVTATRYI